MPHRRPLALLAAAATALALAAPASATPVCTGDIPKQACLGRTVPEPSTTSVSFLTFNEFVDALEDLEAEFPDKLTWGSMGTSVNGHDILVAEVTNADSPIPYEDRKVVYIAQSIHGNEVGGREGMIRIIEDLLRLEDPNTKSLLDQVRLVQYVPNSDGWVRGDWDRVPGSTIFTRGNGNGTDLNRQFPWKGWIPNSRTPLAEPEAVAVVDDVEARLEAGDEIVASADIHGMLQNDAAVWTMLSSGEFDLAGIVRQRRHGAEIEEAVEEALSPKALFILGQAAGDAVVPHVLTSSSEFQGGLSGSGFLGDWLAQKDGANSASVSTIEMFHNQPQQSFVYNREIAQIHVDAVRAIVRTLMEQALVEPAVSVDLPGPVGYLHDPLLVAGATPMRFFEDLEPFLDEPLRPVEVSDLHSGDALAGLSALVVTSDLAASDTEALDAIDAFVEGGGDLVLTDAALRLLPAVTEAVDAGSVSVANTRISNASFQDFDHPLMDHVRDNALHLYEPATLGYNSETADQSPVWRVATSAWESAGGTTLATTASQTSVGEVAEGAGTVRIIGGLLPPPTTQNKVLYGLNDYAPVDTGFFLLLNAIDGELLLDGAAADLDVVSGDVTPEPNGRR